MSDKEMELSIVMPCLNEAKTVGTCIEKASTFLKEYNIRGEIIVADNGSSDGSQEIATNFGARVVAVEVQGYGNALMGGITEARGKYIIMADSDDSYDFSTLMPFVEKLRKGYDLVIGNRFRGRIEPGAMPLLHKYLGNPVLTAIGRLFFRSPSGDFHCGLRGFRKEAVMRLNLQTTGMEFASEMVVKATLLGMRITEIPTTLWPDGRGQRPHLRTWRDGWRHLRFMLLYSPRWLFLYPGILLMSVGLIVGARLVFGPISVGSINFDVQTLLFTVTSVIIGYQSVLFALFTKVFATNEGLLPQGSRLARFPRSFSLEIGLVIGATLFIAGLAGAVYAVQYWGNVSSFGSMNPRVSLRIVIPSIGAMIVGLQSVLGSFFLSILGLRRKSRPLFRED